MLPSTPRATVACFDPTYGELPRRRLDAARFAGFLQKLHQAGATGVLIGSSTGQGHIRTVEELESMLRAAAEVELPGTIRQALFRPEDGVSANERLLDLAAELAYDIVFFRPSMSLPQTTTEDQLVSELQPLVRAAAQRGLRVGLYSISDVSGVALPATAVARLVRGDGGDHIVSVKVTEANYETSTLPMLEHPELRSLMVVQGWDPHLARALRDGGRLRGPDAAPVGITSGPMSFAIEQYLHILDAADRQDWTEVGMAQQAVTALFASMQDDPARFADLQRAKYIMGLGHPLLGEVNQEQVERVFVALASLSRPEDRRRLASSLNLMQDGPFADRLSKWEAA